MKQQRSAVCQRALGLILSAVLLLGALPVGAGAAAGHSPVAATVGAAPDYYGRNALSHCPNPTALLYVYDRIVEGVERGAATIPVYNEDYPIPGKELKTVFDAYRRDYPEHFWIRNDYRYSYNSDTGSVTEVYPDYSLSGASLETAKAAFDAAVSEMVRGISGSMGEYDREKRLHDRVAETVVYDSSAAHVHSAYGALVQGKAVCEGYAKAFQVVLRRAGIQSFLITGSSVNPSTGISEGHAWNAVRIDGKYYHVDVTWDDQGDNLFYAYFNKSTAAIREDHTIDEPAYALPVCTGEEADYFVVNGGRLPAFSVEKVADRLRAGDGTARLYCTGDCKAFAAALVDEANVRALAQALGYTGSFQCSYVTLGREFIYTLRGTGGSHGTLTGTVRSYNSATDPVTVQLFRSGSSAAAYSTTVQGTSAAYTLSGVTPGTYTMQVSKKNHVTREYTVTVTTGTKTQNAEVWLLGDVNGDGRINTSDVGKANMHAKNKKMLTGYEFACADINGDGKVNTSDVGKINAHAKGKKLLW